LRHFFTQNDSYNNILTFGPYMQNLPYGAPTVISSSPPSKYKCR